MRGYSETVRASVLLACLLATGAAGGAVALGIAAATGVGDGERTVTVVEQATTVAAVRPGAGPGPAAFDAAAIYAARAPGVVTLYAGFGASESQGSGFVVDGRGTILTNAHVITDVAQSPSTVSGAARLYVEFADGERVVGTIVGWDLFSDVGVVRVDPTDHAVRPVPLGRSADVRVGEPVAAIGSPFGNQSSLSVGVVSATGRQIDSLTSAYPVADAIQVDAPINHGNSGGPLFDGQGRVIGINAQIRSSSGTAEGVGFAIPIDVARRALRQLVATGAVSYAYIGIETQDVTPGIARAFHLGVDHGALIARVQPGTPAERAGLRGGSRRAAYNGLDLALGGDLVIRIGTHPVRNAEDVSRIVTDRLRPGQTVPFVVVRGGSRVTVPVELAERPARPS